MQKWDYMDLCPDSEAGYAVMLRDVGEEGWEAVCSWVEEIHHMGAAAPRRVNHILYKRPREADEDLPTRKCPDCGDEQPDYDGFGTLHCFKCGFCTHAAITGGVCDLCGKTPKSC